MKDFLSCSSHARREDCRQGVMVVAFFATSLQFTHVVAWHACQRRGIPFAQGPPITENLRTYIASQLLDPTAVNARFGIPEGHGQELVTEG
jgi:hypothetical protein